MEENLGFLIAALNKGRWSIHVSPKQSSLAFDEVKEQNHDQEHEAGFERELKLLINTRPDHNSTVQIAKITGRVTVSF